MSFKKKALLLSAACAVLLLGLSGTCIFDSAAINSQGANSRLIWLDLRFLSYADRIDITGSAGTGSEGSRQVITLLKKNNIWVIPETDGNNRQTDYPARQIRVEELLSLLSRPGNYPVRSTSSVLWIYGLDENASRITVRGGAGPPLLDLFIGYTDLTGGIFLRKAGQSEIRSGSDIFTLYTENDRNFWYDLSIFPGLSADMIQGFSIESENEKFALTRDRNGWIDKYSGTPFPRADSYLRNILDAQGENFTALSDWETSCRLVLETGNGELRALDIGPPGSRGERPARISGSNLVYSIGEWTFKRILPPGFD